MKTTLAKTSIAAALFALGFTTSPAQSLAGAPDSVADMLQRACTVAAGRFEQGWMYNDTGVQWGEVTSCVTESIRLTCQSDICRATGLAPSMSTATLVKQKASSDLGVAVRPERDEFDRVLKSMAMY